MRERVLAAMPRIKSNGCSYRYNRYCYCGEFDYALLFKICLIVQTLPSGLTGIVLEKYRFAF